MGVELAYITKRPHREFLVSNGSIFSGDVLEVHGATFGDSSPCQKCKHTRTIQHQKWGLSCIRCGTPREAA